MILEDTRNDFMQSIYDMFSDDETNNRANQIIDIFDIATENCIELPCKVGDTVYYFKTLQDGKNTVIIEEDVVRQISINSHGKFIVLSFCHCLSCNDFGKTVFLTKESAEQVLRERENK